jgi:hypothetical protein
VSFIDGTVDVGRTSPNTMGVTPFSVAEDENSKKHVFDAKINKMFGKKNDYKPEK